METNKLEELINSSLDNFSNPETSFFIGVEYENLDQKASAFSFYLRAAEYGLDSHPTIAYCSLLKAGLCLEKQGGREYSVSNNYLQAIAYMPNRPEAYYLMSRFYERAGAWQESYTFAEMGLNLASLRLEPMPSSVEYLGVYCLIFQKAISAWWIGRKEESIFLLKELMLSYEMDDRHTKAVLNNIKNLGI